MKTLGRLENAVYWLFDGGFGRIVYGLLAVLLAGAFVANVATVGFDALSWVYGFLAVGLTLMAFNPGDD